MYFILIFVVRRAVAGPSHKKLQSLLYHAMGMHSLRQIIHSGDQGTPEITFSKR